MDFGSIVESLAGGPLHWGTWPVSSACAHNCFDKNHYHRHCGCALHSIDTGFTGSPACSPSNTVKVSGPASRSGRMYRSISVQNLGEKKFQSGNVSGGSGGNSYSGGDSVTSPALRPGSFSSSVSSLSHNGMGEEDQSSAETLMLVEELATFINLMNDKDACTTTEHDDDEIGTDASGWTTDEDDELRGLPNLHQNQPVIVPNRSTAPKPPCAPVNRPIPLRLSLLEKLSISLSNGLDVPVRDGGSSIRRMKSCSR